MAQKVIISKTDDIDGSNNAETIPFSIDGHSYEIDLSESNANGMRAIMAPYIASGRKVSGPNTGRKRRRPRSKTRDIREWAIQNGYENLKPRGRVPVEIIREYERAHEPDANGPVANPGSNGQGKTRDVAEPTEPRRSVEEIAADIVTDTLTRQEPTSKEVRRWAFRQGYKLNASGRVPRNVMNEYLEAHKE
jgi:hypothetical protein